MDAEKHAEKKGSNFVATGPLRQHRGGTPIDCSSPELDSFGSASAPQVQPLPFASNLPMAQLPPIRCPTAFGALAQDSDGADVGRLQPFMTGKKRPEVAARMCLQN